MRRTTICRSDVSRAAAAFALLLAAAPLAAQAPTMITRPIQQARHAAAQESQHAAQQQQPSAQQPAPAPAQQRAPQQPQAQQPAAAQGAGRPLAPPETHTVQQGETLWSLAHQFLGDPLLWPEIYRLNTNVVEDPHWIFPGEELRLVAPSEQPAAAPAAAPAAVPSGNVSITPTADSTHQAPAPATPLPSTDAPTIFVKRAPVTQANVQQQEEQRAYRGVLAGEYYSSGFVADPRTLEPGMLGGNLDKTALRRLSARSSAGMYASVVVAAPASDAYKRGDLLLAYEAGATIVGYGEIVHPLGLLRVTADGGTGETVSATVIALYNALHLGSSVLKVPAFRDLGNARAVPTDSGVEGQVIASRREGEIVSVQDVLFVNVGADDGVRLGDVFRISAAATQSGARRDQAEAVVVHTRAKTATLVVIQVSQPDIRPGAAARQIRRMPS